MDCTVNYGLGCDIQHDVTMPVADAFRMIRDHKFVGWAFVNVYYDHRLIYTTQGLAGYTFICDDCPYRTKKGEKK